MCSGPCAGAMRSGPVGAHSDDELAEGGRRRKKEEEARRRKKEEGGVTPFIKISLKKSRGPHLADGDKDAKAGGLLLCYFFYPLHRHMQFFYCAMLFFGWNLLQCNIA